MIGLHWLGIMEHTTQIVAEMLFLGTALGKRCRAGLMIASLCSYVRFNQITPIPVSPLEKTAGVCFGDAGNGENWLLGHGKDVRYRMI